MMKNQEEDISRRLNILLIAFIGIISIFYTSITTDHLQDIFPIKENFLLLFTLLPALFAISLALLIPASKPKINIEIRKRSIAGAPTILEIFMAGFISLLGLSIIYYRFLKLKIEILQTTAGYMLKSVFFLWIVTTYLAGEWLLKWELIKKLKEIGGNY